MSTVFIYEFKAGIEMGSLSRAMRSFGLVKNFSIEIFSSKFATVLMKEAAASLKNGSRIYIFFNLTTDKVALKKYEIYKSDEQIVKICDKNVQVKRVRNNLSEKPTVPRGRKKKQSYDQDEFTSRNSSSAARTYTTDESSDEEVEQEVPKRTLHKRQVLKKGRKSTRVPSCESESDKSDEDDDESDESGKRKTKSSKRSKDDESGNRKKKSSKDDSNDDKCDKRKRKSCEFKNSATLIKISKKHIADKRRSGKKSSAEDTKNRSSTLTQLQKVVLRNSRLLRSPKNPS